MIQAGTALVRGNAWDEMASEAVRSAKVAANIPELERPDVVLLFSAGETLRQAERMVSAARLAAGGAPVVGCGGAGVLFEREECESTDAVSALVIRATAGEVVFQPLIARDLERDAASAGAALAKQAVASFAAKTARPAIVLFPDAFVLSAPPLIGGLISELPETLVVGGAAASGYGQSARQWSDGEVFEHGASGLALSGSAAIRAVVAQGTRVLGPWRRITAAHDNVIESIDGKPAFDLFAELIGAPLRQDLARAMRTVLVAHPASPSDELPTDDTPYLVRGIGAVDPERNLLALGQRARVGEPIRFVLREAHAARSTLVASLEQMKLSLEGRAPAFGIYLNCAGRGEGLFGVADHDVAYIQKTLGEFPLVGLFSGGEIGPRAPSDLHPVLHLFTGVLLVVSS